MTERNIVAEVLEGLREVRDHCAGRRTLKTVRVEPRPFQQFTPEAIRGSRDRLDVSRAVFAHMIRVPVRTVEHWEQGRSTPPESAAALILMAQKYPDTFERLASLWPARTSSTGRLDADPFQTEPPRTLDRTIRPGRTKVQTAANYVVVNNNCCTAAASGHG